MVKMITSFIEKNFNQDYSFANSLDNLFKLKDYITNEFEAVNYNDLLAIIEKSDILSMSLKVLMKCSSHELKTTIVDLYFEDTFIFNIINAYCELKGIIIDAWLEHKDKQTAAIAEKDMLDLIKSAQAGDKEAVEMILEMNSGLIRKAVLKHLNKSKLEYEDLLQESQIGLLKAINGFDASKGFKFSSYAFDCMEAVINRAIYYDGVDIRIPQQKIEKVKKAYAVKMRLIDTYGFEPSTEMVAKECGYPVDLTEELLQFKVPTVINMQELLTGNEDRTLEEILPADVNIEKDFIERAYYNYVLKVVESYLTPVEFEVILYRMGFVDNKEYTQEDISFKLGISRQRINQIEQKAIQKLHSKPVHDLLRVVDYKSLGRKFRDLTSSKYLTYNTIYIKEPTSLFEHFKEYTHEEVLRAVSLLKDSYKDILYHKFGKKLDRLLPARGSNTGLFYNEIKPLIEDNLVKMSPNKGRNSVLVWFSGADKEKIIEAVNKISLTNNAIFYKRFGTDLDELNPLEPAEREILYETVIPYLQNYIKYKNINHKKIFDYFRGYSEEEIVSSLNYLPKEYLNIVISKFGDKLDSNNYISIPNQRILECKIIPKIKTTVEGLRKDQYFLKVFAGVDCEELYKALNKLDSKERGLLFERYGEGLDTIKMTNLTIRKHLYNVVIPKLFEYLGIEYDYNFSIADREISFYFPRNSLHDIKEAIGMLDEDEQRLVYDRFGTDLRSVNKTDQAGALYFNIFNKIRSNLIEIKRNKIINYSSKAEYLMENEANDIQKAARMICELNSSLDDLDLLIYILANGIGVNFYTVSKVSRMLNKTEYYICIAINRITKEIANNDLYNKLMKISRAEKKEKRLEMQKNNKKFAF